MANLKKIIEESFTQYAGAVLQSRALVDVRDCLKPSSRQIFYSMNQRKLTHKNSFKKTTNAIGMAMADYYIHGDSSAEGIIMRAGQPFVMRYPLIEVEGSYGNLMASGNWAAPRYTASRLSEFSDILFEGIKKDTVLDWRDNYDDTKQYPAVLPSIGFYNIVNGTMGIGIGAASSIPSFNLKEVNKAIIKLIENPEVSFDDIVCYPDFPTGATILNKKEVKEYLREGQGGSCKIRSTITYNPDENCLIVTEIPFMLYTETICKELEEILNNETCPSIERFNDLTGESPLIKIYLKKGSNYNKVLKFLYKNTSLESFYAINMTMLKDGRYPTVFGWKSALQEYITHIRTCKRREIQFDLDKALARENVLKGLLLASANIDEVVSIIRASDSPAQASAKLIARFNFNEEQTKAILAMKLSSLTKIDAIKLNDELAEIKKKIECLNDILRNPQKLDAELIKILREVADKFGDERRTKIMNITEEEENEQEQIEEKDIAVMLFSNNSIRMVAQNDILGAKKGRKGKNLPLPKNAKLVDTLYTTNLSSVYAITQTGKLYSTSLSHLSENEDFSLYELGIDGEDKIVKVFSTMNFDFNKYLCFFTKQGMIKKTLIGEYLTRTRKGTQAIKLKPGDEVIECLFLPNDKGEIMTASSGGCIVRFAHEDIAPTGRVAIGVKGMKLENGETLVSACYIDDAQKYKGVLTLSSKGKGKITSLNEFSCTNRTAKGVIAQKLDNDEKLNMICLVKEEEDNFNLLTDNTVVSLSSTDIPIQGRATSGNKLIDLKDKNVKVKVLGR